MDKEVQGRKAEVRAEQKQCRNNKQCASTFDKVQRGQSNNGTGNKRILQRLCFVFGKWKDYRNRQTNVWATSRKANGKEHGTPLL